MQLKFNTSAESVITVQKCNTCGNYDLQKGNEKVCKPMISCKAMQNVCTETLKKNAKKMASGNLPALFPRELFLLILLISNHMALLVQNLELICTCKFFEKLKLHSPKQLGQFQLFEKLTPAN